MSTSAGTTPHPMMKRSGLIRLTALGRTPRMEVRRPVPLEVGREVGMFRQLEQLLGVVCGEQGACRGEQQHGE
jgi:hypothetical protein